jgi:hypothetical protein
MSLKLRSHILKSLPVTYVTSAFQQKYILNVFYSKNTFVRFCILKNIEREREKYLKGSEISNFNQIGLLQHVDMSLNDELKRKEQEIENEGRDEFKRIKKINML